MGDELRYQTSVTLPEKFLPDGFRALLHFGAVDQVAEVFVNGTSVIRHEGGYLPFSEDITDVLCAGENCLEVAAVDTLSHDYPYGKQHRRPHGMWYTPVSGIWQPVWLEAVPARDRIRAVRFTPDLTGVSVSVEADGAEYRLTVPLEDGTELTAVGTGDPVRLELPEPHLWTPDDPYLYTMKIATSTDQVESYFALRTVSTKEQGGHTRLYLNGKPVFLDQGYFYDGLFLPKGPEEELSDRIRAMYEDMVLPSIPNGLCGCIYTQLSDVEGETNGLYTYDRVVRKVSTGVMKNLAERVTGALLGLTP